MRIIEGLVLRKLLNENIVTGEGLARVDFSKVISLNETAAYLWNEVQDREFSLDDLVTLLTDRYDVSEDVARADAQRMLDSWRDAGLLED